MCCSAWPASFSGTITGVSEILSEGILKHVVWYQNKVGAHSVRNRGHHVPGGNCLIIPLLGAWESIEMLDTQAVPFLLTDIEAALRPRRPSALTGWGAAALRAPAAEARLAYFRFDVYDIVVAERASAIPSALTYIDPRKRPNINYSVFESLDRWYRCPVAVCCFNDNDVFEAKPLAFSFEPMFPDRFVVYTLDGHDGTAPDLNGDVMLDHTIFVSSSFSDQRDGSQVLYRDKIPQHLQCFVPRTVLGTHINSYMKNGDFVFMVDDVRKGIFDGARMNPPFAHGSSIKSRLAINKWPQF